MKKISPFFNLALLIILIIGCGKNRPLPGSYERIIGTNEGAIADTILVLETGSENYYSKLMNTSTSSELLLGSYEQYNSGIFLQFTDLPDSIQINSAELVLSMKSRTAPGDADSTFWDIQRLATVNAFLADTLWDENSPPQKNFDLQLSSFTIYSDSTNNITIPLDSGLVNQWIDTLSTIHDYGIWLECSHAEFIQIYYSLDTFDATIVPKINLYYTIIDSQGVAIDTNKVVYVREDAFVLLNNEQDLNLDPDLFYIGKGLAFHNIFKFNFDFIDTLTHINRAFLELKINQSYSIRNLAGMSDAILYRLSEEWIEGNEITGSSYSPTVSDSLLIFDITPTIQTIIDKKYDNFGFFVKSTNEGETISRIAFYSSKSNFELQPKLHVYYSLPTKQEF